MADRDGRPTLYDVLGVTPDASARELRTAYRRQLMSSHPDHGGDARRTLALRDAIAVLGNEVRRHAYDTLLRAELAPARATLLPAVPDGAPAERRSAPQADVRAAYDRRWELRVRYGPGGPRRRREDPKDPTDVAL